MSALISRIKTLGLGALCACGLMISSLPSHADDAADKAAISATIENLYKAISGPVGQERDWPLFDSLYAENAQMRVARVHPEHGQVVINLTPEDYKTRGGERLKQIGFTEKELGRRTYIYGNMATVMSSYEGLRTDNNSVIAKGINSIALVKTKDGWKVAHIMWSEENDNWPIARGFEASNSPDLGK